MRNIALLLRWWWKGYNDPTGLWGATICVIRWQGFFQPGPFLWSKQGSFFWGQLLSIKHLFDWSITWSVGDRTTISFWYDKWGPQVLRQPGTRCINHALSLQGASLLHPDLIPDDLQFNQGQVDILSWNWEVNAHYSARSVYRILTGGGLVRGEFTAIWKYCIPPSVRIFLYLLLHDKLLTREVMVTRCFNIQDSSCPLCTSCDFETAHHLFFECTYSKRIWDNIASAVGCNVVVRGDSVGQVWRMSGARFRRNLGTRTRWQNLFSSACWSIWRFRNCRVFEGRIQHVDMVTEWIIRQATLWERCCKAKAKTSNSTG